MQRYSVWMREAIEDAQKALESGDVPVAAFVLDAHGKLEDESVDGEGAEAAPAKPKAKRKSAPPGVRKP